MTNKKTVARISCGTLVEVSVLLRKVGFFGGVKYLVAFRNKIAGDDGKILYENTKTEWVSKDNVFFDYE